MLQQGRSQTRPLDTVQDTDLSKRYKYRSVKKVQSLDCYSVAYSLIPIFAKRHGDHQALA